MADVAPEVQDTRFLLQEVYAAIEDASCTSEDGKRLPNPGYTCSQRSSRLQGAFLALHRHALATGMLAREGIHEPVDLVSRGNIDEEFSLTP